MPFDDDDDPASGAAQVPAVNAGGPSAEEALEDGIHDHKLFASMFSKKGVSGKIIRKGEKDFESHGTRAQENTLEASRTALEEVLNYTRVHRLESWLRAWYFPDWWTTHSPDSKTDDPLLQDRVVVMEHERGNWMRDIGRAVSGSKDQLGVGRLWLLPEEALYLIERGTVDIWWPDKEFEELLPKVTDGVPARNSFGPDDYDVGLPLSVEAAYCFLIGYEGERGKTTLAKFQVYTHLKRAGFHVMRAPSNDSSLSQKPDPSTSSTSLWEWLFTMIPWQRHPQHRPFGPLVSPGLYRAYRPIYQQLALLPRHRPLATPIPHHVQEPFRVHFHVWRGTGAPFSKKNPPPPDFRIAVCDTADSMVPTLEQIEALLESTPFDPPNPAWQGPGRLYQRLKHGYRNVLVAVVDSGLVNFMRFGEAAFGEEPLFERFDNRNVITLHTLR
ncbi:related to tRNA-splicing endonuclease [Claviceps purpurea 20.1]|uniref:Related to tRNA-splicing endonuclease n=1 Tax=Claviceps purpurea (strain 20.1) TaxID=1111077 RepID=M1W693_CLAP2|nr:related to tRNA-splicing endonuclease [Claviceps purpurea 20.1]